MTLKILTAVALATTVFAVSTAAEAGKRHGGGIKKHRNFHHGGHIRFHDHWDGGYGYYEPANCHYFFRKARHTGSRYWWKKYRICISRY